MRRWILIGSAVAAFALSPLTAAATPTSFQLVFDGHHVVATFPSPTGLSHVGSFTTNYPACPSGTAGNTAETDAGVATRLFTCTGSDATFTALVWPQLSEHGGSGSWRIIAGTGPLANLRGQGSFSSVLTSGDPNNFITIDFASTWTGTVDLDATPPTITLTKDRIVRIKQPKGAYKLSLALAVTDNDGAPVRYSITLIDPTTLDAIARKNGNTSAGPTDWTLVLRPTTRTRTVRLQVDATDAVGNQSTIKHTIELMR